MKQDDIIPRPLIAAGSWAGFLNDHPRLFGDARHLRDLAAAKPEGYREIRTLKGDQWFENITHDHARKGPLIPAAIVHAVEGLGADEVRPFIDKALAYVAGGPSNIHQDSWLQLEQVAITYDAFFGEITPADRQRMIEWMNAHLQTFVDDENAFHNSTLSKMYCYLRIAYATWGENPMARTFRDHALVTLYEGKVLPVLRHFGAGGGYTECGWYCRHSVYHLAKALELARRFEGYDGFAMAGDFFRNRLAYEIHQAYPGLWKHGAERFACEGDGQTYYSEFKEFPRLLRTVLMNYYRGSELARYAANLCRRGSSPGIRVTDFLDEEPHGQPLPLEDFPLSHLAGGIGRLYARSGWSDDATWLRFECGDYFNQHQHFEAGNFEIFRREPLAAESGVYCGWSTQHAVNWQVRTIAHNCILIRKPGQTWEYCRNRDNHVMANDGGQGSNTFICDTLDEYLRVGGPLRRGHIAAYQSRPQFTYVAGDATAGYGDRAQLVRRQIVFIRPHVFVMLDRVVAAQADFAKTWLMHCHFEPKIDGGAFSVANGPGKLHVQTLLPRAARIAKIEGYSYAGQSYEPRLKLPPELAATWRIEVQPPGAQQADTFLHVMCTDGPVEARLIERDGQVGAAGDGWEVLLDEGLTGTVKIAGQAWALGGGVEGGRYET